MNPPILKPNLHSLSHWITPKQPKKDNEENNRSISTYKRYIERNTNLRENHGNLKRISITERYKKRQKINFCFFQFQDRTSK